MGNSRAVRLVGVSLFILTQKHFAVGGKQTRPGVACSGSVRKAVSRGQYFLASAALHFALAEGCILVYIQLRSVHLI